MPTARKSDTSLRQTEQFQKGRSGEHVVANLLKQRGWYVIPSYDYSGEEGNKAPRLEGFLESFVVPDLDIAKEGKRRWVEVKTKAAATYTKITKQLEHGIPLTHFDDYLQIEKITGCEVWLFIYEEDTQSVLSGRLKDLVSRARIYGGNKMNRGGMVFFPQTAFRLFDHLDDGGNSEQSP